ncbi:hypothetical protein HMPREF0880_02100 [Yokenella regensburgei ATCC 43003]|nr:hypothetical protein HMPREF0880_02100 [Yokenella regensburgei ATCC 43003]
MTIYIVILTKIFIVTLTSIKISKITKSFKINKLKSWHAT